MLLTATKMLNSESAGLANDSTPGSTLPMHLMMFGGISGRCVVSCPLSGELAEGNFTACFQDILANLGR
jgi:hypothetical protein